MIMVIRGSIIGITMKMNNMTGNVGREEELRLRCYISRGSV